MIIAIEGLDGAGKSTVGRILADAIGAAFIPVPPPKLKLVRGTLFRELTSEARYAYYVSGVLSVAEMACESRLVVADRFVASAHAMHLDITSHLAEALRALPLPAPDLTFYLEVDETARRQRLRDRGRDLDPFEERLAADDAFRNRVAQRMRAYEPTYIVDTTGRGPEAVAERARRIWEEISWSDGV
jgi:thymidylate kinase